MKSRWLVTILSVVAIILVSGLLYFLVLKTTRIDCGFVIEKKYNGNSISLMLTNGEETKWIKISNKHFNGNAEAYNVVLNGVFIKSIIPCKIYTGKVLSKDYNMIEVANNEFKLAPKVYYYNKTKNYELLSSSSVIVGYDSYKFILNGNGMIGAVIVQNPTIDKIRVGISNNNFTSLDHQNIFLSSKRSFQIYSKDLNLKISKGEAVKISYSNGYIYLYDYSGNVVNGKGTYSLIKQIGKTKNRLYISSLSDKAMFINSIKRSDGYIPRYYGTLEVFIRKSSLRIINETPIEQYLKFVVPSEMLSSGGTEGYKVQAVAARTYAISDMFAERFAKYGFHVDDTILSQAYNHQPSNTICDQAVDETSGKVMTYKGKIIDAKYYSTSCGVGAPFNEVWYKSLTTNKNNTEPYLTFHDYTDSNIKDMSDETKCSDFLMDWTVKSYDSNSPYFRWKYSLDIKTFNKVINANIYKRYKKDPGSFKKSWYFGIYKQAEISKNGIGKINDVFISKRGKGGNVLEMTIDSDTGKYKIEKESNIKYMVTPHRMNYEVTKLYGDPLESPSNLPSGFFVIDKQMENSKIKVITVYGGGFGHGVGMSQYGTIGLVRHGKNYKTILKTFYYDVNIVDYNTAINSSLKITQ